MHFRIIYFFLSLFWVGILTPALGQSPPNPSKNNTDLTRFLQDLFPIQSDGVDYQSVFDNLAQLYANPINLNTATPDELAATYLLSERQLTSLLTYRQAYGNFVSLYELQAVPDLDLATIRRLISFVTISDNLQSLPTPTDHYLLLRYEHTLEQQKGFTEAIPDKNGKLPARYLGNAQQWFARYRYNRPNAYSFGITLEKDPGERISWNPRQHQYGPDYVSFHAQIQHRGRLKNIVMGDYQMQIGQGLLLSAGFVMGKNSETILTVRRPTLGARAYTSLTEATFFRGASATYTVNRMLDLTLFAARNRRSANVVPGQASDADIVTSFLTSGLHRTEAELADRLSTVETNLGAHLLYHSGNRLQIGLTALRTAFDKGIQKRDQTYNQYEFTGRQNMVVGLHGSYSWQNINFFGEFARSSGSLTHSGGIGLVTGTVASLNKRTDLALVVRHYDRNFHSFYANGFGENSRTINETGGYLGLKYSLYRRWKVGGYIDVFHFPWWRYLVDRPSSGVDYLAQGTYTPNRHTTFSVIVHGEQKEKNKPGSKTVPKEVISTRNRQLVLNADYRFIKSLSFHTRLQGSRFRYVGSAPSQGITLVQDVNYERKRWSISGRIALFNTDDYDSRLYVYERDVLYAFSFPAYFYNGIRHYVLLQYNASRHLDIWLRWARTDITNQETVGSDLDQINVPHKSEVKMQIRWKF